MADESQVSKRRNMQPGGVSTGVYGMGFIGAVVYFIQQSTTFWMGVLGFFKAIFWPAFLIYKLFEYLKV